MRLISYVFSYTITPPSNKCSTHLLLQTYHNTDLLVTSYFWSLWLNWAEEHPKANTKTHDLRLQYLLSPCSSGSQITHIPLFKFQRTLMKQHLYKFDIPLSPIAYFTTWGIQLHFKYQGPLKKCSRINIKCPLQHWLRFSLLSFTFILKCLVYAGNSFMLTRLTLSYSCDQNFYHHTDSCLWGYQWNTQTPNISQVSNWKGLSSFSSCYQLIATLS